MNKTSTAPIPYSPLFKSGQLVFIAGHIGLDNKTSTLSPDFETQLKQLFKNLEATLKSAGLDFGDVINTTVYLTNMDNYPLLNTVYSEYFRAPYPARSTVAVVALPRQALVEIELIASKKHK